MHADEYLGLVPLTTGRAGEAARAVLAGVLAWWGLGLFLVDAILQLLFLFLVLASRGVMILRRNVLHGCRGSRSGARFLRLHFSLVVAHRIPHARSATEAIQSGEMP